MLLSLAKSSGSGLTELRNEEEWAAKEVHFTGDKHKISVTKKKDKHKISKLPQSPSCPSLISLYLQENSEPAAIPPSFFHRLQVLDLFHTSIKSLPNSLPKLVALKKLLLRGCQLFMELSPQVGKLENLEELDLYETQIMDLPRQIAELLKLRHLRVSFYPICGKKKSKSSMLIDPEMISVLSQLTELSIDVDPADRRWDDSVEAVVKEVSKSETLRTLSLYLPKFQLLDTTSLIYPSLSRFRFTVGHQKKRIISRVPREVKAAFRNWDKCLKFVNGGNIPSEIKGILKHSTSFFLEHHATATSLSEFGIKNMRRLKFCLLAECNKMEALIDGEMHYYERNKDDQSESDSDSVEQVLESLKYLSIYHMENLGSIWRGPNLFGCMSKLKFLALHACPQLNSIFPLPLLENLVNLEDIILEDCPQVTSLVSHASVKPIMSYKCKIFLPSLKRLVLLYLPELVSISNGLLIAPKLESIGCYNCPKLKSISEIAISRKTLKIIRGECQWWEDMNRNDTVGGNPPDYLMCIFSPIDNEKDVMTQFAEVRDLLEAIIEKEGQQPEKMASSCYSNSPCAACKFLRRKCMPDCIYAPYFPPEEPQKFANVHKIFGASNVSKLLHEMAPHQREDAVNSLAYEAEARMKDPVYGCVGAISVLQRQVMRLQRELDATNADLIRYASNEIPAATAAISHYDRKTAAGHGSTEGGSFFNQNSGFYHPSQWNNIDPGGDHERSGSGSC